MTNRSKLLRWFTFAGLVALMAMSGCTGGKTENPGGKKKTNDDSVSEPQVSPSERFVGTWDTHAVVDKEVAIKYYSGPSDGEQWSEEQIETEATRMVNAIRESTQSTMKFDSDGTLTQEGMGNQATWEVITDGDELKLTITFQGQSMTASPIFQDDDTFLVKRTPSPEEPPITHTIYKRRKE